jgi:hypothetical protein
MWELLTGEEPYANMHYGAIIGMSLTNTRLVTVPKAVSSLGNCNRLIMKVNIYFSFTINLETFFKPLFKIVQEV